MIMWIPFALRQGLKVKCIHGYAESAGFVIRVWNGYINMIMLILFTL